MSGRAHRWACWLVGLLLCGLPSVLRSEVRTLESASFLLVASDAPGLLYARDLAVRGEQLWMRRFGGVAEAPRVRVVLEPEVDSVKRAGTGVNVPWNNATERADLSLALAEAWWWRQESLSGGKRTPAWLVMASAALLEMSLNPLFGDVLAEQRAGQPFHSLDALFQASTLSVGEWGACLLLLQSLESRGVSGRVLLETNRLSLNRRLRAQGLGEAVADLWWATEWATARETPVGPHWSIAASIRRIEALATFLVRERGVEAQVGVDRLPSLLGQPGLGAVVNRRAEQIRKDLPFIHPIFHNAFASLGEVYEAYEQGSPAKAEGASERFAGEWARSRQLAGEIEMLIRE